MAEGGYSKGDLTFVSIFISLPALTSKEVKQQTRDHRGPAALKLRIKRRFALPVRRPQFKCHIRLKYFNQIWKWVDCDLYSPLTQVRSDIPKYNRFLVF